MDFKQLLEKWTKPVRILAQARVGDYFQFIKPDTTLDKGPCLVLGKDATSITVLNILHGGIRTFALARGGDAVFHPLNDSPEDGRRWTESAWDFDVRADDSIRFSPNSDEDWWIYSVFQSLVKQQMVRHFMGELPLMPKEVQASIAAAPGGADDDGSVAWGQALSEDDLRGLVYLSINAAYTAIIDPAATEWVMPEQVMRIAHLAESMETGTYEVDTSIAWEDVFGSDFPGFDA